MHTHHRLLRGEAAGCLDAVEQGSVALVITSPPYPMVQMWDAGFAAQSTAVADALAAEDGPAAHAAMHACLDPAWAACHRVLMPGGFLCINIGDATRTLGKRFRLYSNHSRVLAAAERLGFDVLPDILWHKPTNFPTKFMGSGMLPAGAYVTYEHEYVLVLRKGGKRGFSRAADKARRRRSAYFWEERNAWFTDVWTGLRGVRQGLDATVASADRSRSAAFPFALAWRLAHMFSLHCDTVLDPFCGTGTAMVAAACAGRSSVGVERDPSLHPVVRAAMAGVLPLGQRAAADRLAAHRAFVAARGAAGKGFKHHNVGLDLPVMSRQEADLVVLAPTALDTPDPWTWRVRHAQAVPPAPEPVQQPLLG